MTTILRRSRAASDVDYSSGSEDEGGTLSRVKVLNSSSSSSSSVRGFSKYNREDSEEEDSSSDQVTLTRERAQAGKEKQVQVPLRNLRDNDNNNRGSFKAPKDATSWPTASKPNVRKNVDDDKKDEPLTVSPTSVSNNTEESDDHVDVDVNLVTKRSSSSTAVPSSSSSTSWVNGNKSQRLNDRMDDGNEKENDGSSSSLSSSASRSDSRQWKPAKPSRALPPPKAPAPYTQMNGIANSLSTSTSNSKTNDSDLKKRDKDEKGGGEGGEGDDEGKEESTRKDNVGLGEAKISAPDAAEEKIVTLDTEGGSKPNGSDEKQEDESDSDVDADADADADVDTRDDAGALVSRDMIILDGDDYENEDSDVDIVKQQGPRANRSDGRNDIMSTYKEGSFSNYIDDVEKRGITVPRKSGMYYENGGNNSRDLVSTDKEAGGDSPRQHSPIPRPNRNISFVLKAHKRGTKSEHVQCTIVRDRSTLEGRLYPTYELILDDNKKVIMIARKMNMNRTSNYHLFDMTRGAAGAKLSKKSGNYLGKLRAKNINRTGYVLLTKNRVEKEEIAAVAFDRLGLFDQLKEGSQPRKMTVVVPMLDEHDVPKPNKVCETFGGLGGGSSLYDYIHSAGSPPEPESKMHTFESKDPFFENGNYRLNFKGRVLVASVKNFQLVSELDVDDIICQFGKVGEDRFHLDFKAPLNAFQAFALALCQFNL